MEGNGLCAPLAALMLLTYHVLLPSFIPTGLVLSHHASRTESIINEMLGRFNDSVVLVVIKDMSTFKDVIALDEYLQDTVVGLLEVMDPMLGVKYIS